MCGKTRAVVEKEFLAEMDRLRVQASKLKDRDYLDMMLQIIDESTESFSQVPFENVNEMVEHATSSILFVSSWVSHLYSQQFLDEELEYEDWLQSIRRRRY
jgi:hypothetical protein